MLSDQRGGASAEGAIVAGFLVLLFAATMFAYRGYRAQMYAVRAPTRALWQDALEGCPGGAPAAPLLDPLGGFPRTAHAMTPTIAARWAWVRRQRLSRAESRTIGEGAVLGGEEVRFDENARVECNPLGATPAIDPRREALSLFCWMHPAPEWAAGCDPSADPGGEHP